MNMENKAKSALAECYVSIDKLPDEDGERAWGLLAMALCNVAAALAAPELIGPNLDFQADVAIRGLALIKKLETGGSVQEWHPA